MTPYTIDAVKTIREQADKQPKGIIAKMLGWPDDMLDRVCRRHEITLTDAPEIEIVTRPAEPPPVVIAPAMPVPFFDKMSRRMQQRVIRRRSQVTVEVPGQVAEAVRLASFRASVSQSLWIACVISRALRGDLVCNEDYEPWNRRLGCRYIAVNLSDDEMNQLSDVIQQRSITRQRYIRCAIDAALDETKPHTQAVRA